MLRRLCFLHQVCLDSVPIFIQFLLVRFLQVFVHIVQADPFLDTRPLKLIGVVSERGQLVDEMVESRRVPALVKLIHCFSVFVVAFVNSSLLDAQFACLLLNKLCLLINCFLHG